MQTISNSSELVILYGSQFGNSKALAQQLQQLFIENKINVPLFSCNEYSIKNLPNQDKVIFIVSTTGQGQPPDNMKNFWDFLLIKDLPSDSLKNVKYAIFGMGSSRTQQYNYTAKRLDARLQQLSAKPFFQMQFGDQSEEFGYYPQFNKWKNEILTYFGLKNFQLNSNLQNADIQDALIIESPQKYKPQMQQIFTLNSQSLQPIQTKIISHNTLTPPNSEKKVTQIEFLYSKEYNPGQSVGILPQNNLAQVNWLLNYFKLQKGQFLNIKYKSKIKKNEKKTFPEIISVEELFLYWIDITSPPSRQFLQTVSAFSVDSSLQQKLLNLSKDDEQSIKLYHQEIIVEKKNIIELIQEYKIERLPLVVFIKSISINKPREYSISNYNQERIRLLVQQHEELTPKKKLFRGLCSSYINDVVKVGDEIFITLNKNNVQFPQDQDTPVLMLAIGSGIAPFLSFIEYRQKLLDKKESSNSNNNNNKTILYFGCRHKTEDFLFKEYLEEMSKNGLLELHTAFSRDQEKKIYIQDAMKENSQKLSKYILNSLNKVKIYVCGKSQNFPEQIKLQLTSILNEANQNGHAILSGLQTNNQFVVDIW